MEQYERLKILGVGSFGKVYLMRHRQQRRLVCAKIMKVKNIPRKEREACRTEVTRSTYPATPAQRGADAALLVTHVAQNGASRMRYMYHIRVSYTGDVCTVRHIGCATHCSYRLCTVVVHRCPCNSCLVPQSISRTRGGSTWKCQDDGGKQDADDSHTSPISTPALWQGGSHAETAPSKHRGLQGLFPDPAQGSPVHHHGVLRRGRS